MAHDIEYERGSASSEELQGALDALLKALQTDPELRAEAEAAGIDAGDQELIARDGIRAERRTKEEFTGLEFVAIYIAAPVAVHILESFWDNVAKPWIEDKLGDDALKKRHVGDGRTGPE